MKKKLLLFPIMCLFLSGCAFLDFFKKQSDNQNQGTPDNTENTEETPGNPEEKPEEVTNSTTFLTSGATFFSDGTNFNNVEKNNDLLNTINSQMSGATPFSEISCDYLVARAWSGINYLQLGTNSGAGLLGLTSNKTISSIEVEVMCYVKDNGSGYNIHNDSHFHIDDSDFDLSYDSYGGTKLPELVKFKKTYSTAVNTFTFESSVNRVFLKSFKITWAE